MSGKSGQNGFSAVGFLFSDSLLVSCQLYKLRQCGFFWRQKVCQTCYASWFKSCCDSAKI